MTDPVREAYERGEMPVQSPCPCCVKYAYPACAAVVESERTGRCAMLYGPVRPPEEMPQCECYGSRADGGLCEDCYISTK